MVYLCISFVAPVNAPEHPTGNPGKIYIIVPRPYAYLGDLLAKAFERREDVEILVDRRHGERRTLQQPVALERRQAQRREAKGEVIEVVIRRSA